jgi:FPC/CPF motif-containing protein YcgG
MVRAITDNFTILKTPNRTPRPGSLSQRALDFGRIVFQSRRVLQHIHDSKRDPRVEKPDCELIREIHHGIPPFDESPQHPDLDHSFRLPIR